MLRRPFLWLLFVLSLQSIVFGESGTLPVPSADVQNARRKILDETFEIAEARTDIQKTAVVEQLAKFIGDRGTSEDDVYVAVTSLLPLAAGLGMWDSLQEHLAELSNYQIDFPAERARHSAECLKGIETATALDAESDSITSIVLETAIANRYSEAEAVLGAAEQASRRLRSRKLTKLLPSLKKYLNDRKVAYEASVSARKELVDAPESPMANTVIGKWLGIYEGDWSNAYRHLEKSDEPKWKAAAMAFQGGGSTQPSGYSVSATLGDCWFDIAAASSGTEQKTARRLTGVHYRKALQEITDSLKRARIDKRLADLAKQDNRSEPERTVDELLATLWRKEEVSRADEKIAAAIPNEAVSLPNGTRELPKGEWTDLLPLIKLPDHILLGRWNRSDTGVLCEPSWDARLQVPVAVAGSYEVEMEFTRHSGADHVDLVLPVGWTHAIICLSYAGGKYHGVGTFGGVPIDRLPTNTGLVLQPGRLVNGRRYKLRSVVTVTGETASITAFLDDRQFAQCNGRVSDLSVHPNFSMMSRACLGVGCDNSASEVHSLQLRLLRGGKAFAFGDDFDNPISRPADAPPREIAAKCLTWNNRKYFISDKGITFSEAQSLAARLNGRLLTISSREEQEFLFREGRGRVLWMAAWRRTEDDVWRDERNRVLPFMGAFVPGDPMSTYRELHLCIGTSAKASSHGWIDSEPGMAWHACIEWGAE